MVGIDSKVSNPRTKREDEERERKRGEKEKRERERFSIHRFHHTPPPSLFLTPGQGAYVITFGRAGEDNKNFKLGDLDKTLEGFAGADYDLQDALTGSTDKKTSRRTVDGVGDFYDYEVVGPDSVYLASVTLRNGKVFALFVSSPAKAFAASEAKLRHIVESFTTL